MLPDSCSSDSCPTLPDPCSSHWTFHFESVLKHARNNAIFCNIVTTGTFFQWGWVGFMRYSQPYRQQRTRWAPPLWKGRFCGLVGCRPRCRCRLPDGWCSEELAGNPELCSWVYTLSGNEGPGSPLPPDQRSRRCLWWKGQTCIPLWRSKQIQIQITTKTKAFFWIAIPSVTKKTMTIKHFLYLILKFPAFIWH